MAVRDEDTARFSNPSSSFLRDIVSGRHIPHQRTSCLHPRVLALRNRPIGYTLSLYAWAMNRPAECRTCIMLAVEYVAIASEDVGI